MILKSERLVLNEISWDDLEDIHRLNCCKEIDEYNTLGIPKSLEETKAFLQPKVEDQLSSVRKKYAWTIRNKENVFLGEVGMSLSADRYRKAEIYYLILPQYWANGFATEAAQAIIKFGFEKLNLHRIEAGVATANLGSIKVLEKVGMQREGINRGILPIRGEWFDNYQYAMLETDPRNY